jgi:amino acid adenylation domain-containing protein
LPPAGRKPATLAGIEMLSADERREILEKRSGSAESPTLQETILTWFERHRALHPEAPAVCSGSLVWDYRELDAFANRVRDAVEEHGVRPGDVVAVDATRSHQTVGAILGIWKCGAVWLPLDPRWPEDRSQFAIDDSGAKLVIDSAWLNHSLRSEALARPSDIAGEFVAYVLYTSGSTGRPKGVAVRHASLANFLRSMGRQPGLTGEDTLFSVTPLTFDISLNEVFLPLSVGARVILPDLDAATDPLQVRRLLEQYPVTVMQATPVMWRGLIDAGWKGSSRLRAWCGGETISPELAEQLVGRVGELWNLYGPTETTIWSTVHRVTRVESPVPIGRPIANTQCYVLDSGLEPVPDGVAGDLYIGGAGLAAGYIGHASSATDQSFIPNPFVPGARMYRTGDIARWSEAGELIFLRRNDAQVKVRGHRIELDEVKAALRGCANVRDVAVVARADALAAYVVPEAASLWNPKQVRRDLRARLPEYMVPAVFVCMESLPLTANGKIDLKMLPDAGPDPPPVLEDSALPRNLLEERLQGIWEELLGIHPIGRQDDFFALGGHSLLAAGLFARIEETFGRQMPISTLFRAPTIELLAAAIRETGHRLMWSQVVPIQTGGSGPALFCLPPENALSFRALAAAVGEGYPLYSLQPPGLDGEDTPESTVEGLALRAIEAMRSVQPKGPYFLCGFSFGGYTAYEMACQLTRAGEGVTIAVIDSDLLILPSYWRSLSRPRRMRYVAQRTMSYTKGLLIGTAADREWFRASVKKVWRYRILGKPNVREEDGARLSSAARRVRAAREVAFHRYVPQSCTVNTLFVQSRGMPSKSWDGRSHGWKGLVKGEVSIVGVAGADHISIVADPFVGQLGAALRDWLSTFRK